MSPNTSSSGDTHAAVEDIEAAQKMRIDVTTAFRECLSSFENDEYFEMLRKSRKTLDEITKSGDSLHPRLCDPDALIEALREVRFAIVMTEHMRLDIIKRSTRLMTAHAL